MPRRGGRGGRGGGGKRGGRGGGGRRRGGGAPGERTSRRLADRLERKRGPDGGEVFGGPLASRALKAVGARAMTVDSSMVVGDDFDASKPESQSLYAHEQVHKRGGGGRDRHAPRARDAEETGARAVERMVLHRAQKGESYRDIMADVGARGTQREVRKGLAGAASSKQMNDEGDPEAGYAALVGRGTDHNQIVRDLTKYVVETIYDMEASSRFRMCEDEDY